MKALHLPNLIHPAQSRLGHFRPSEKTPSVRELPLSFSLLFSRPYICGQINWLSCTTRSQPPSLRLYCYCLLRVFWAFG